mgnify:CR=1 FL=1
MNTLRTNEGGQFQTSPLTRRAMLKSMCAGFGYLAFSGLATGAAAPYQSPLLPKPPHFTPRARRIIFLAMQGGPSHLDTFAYKPGLPASAGQGTYIAPVSPFRPRGQSGPWIAALFPKTAAHAPDPCLRLPMHTDHTTPRPHLIPWPQRHPP